MRRLASIAVVFFVLLFIAPTETDGQVVVRPKQLSDALKVSLEDPCTLAATLSKEVAAGVNEDPVAELNKQFNAGKSGHAQEVARFLLDRAHCTAKGQDATRAFAYKTGYIWLTWVGSDAFGATSLRRILVHDPAPPPSRMDLPGVGRFFEVLVARQQGAAITTLISSTEKADETLAQLPAVVAKVVPALFGIAAVTAATPDVPVLVEEPKPAVAFWVTPFEVDLPAKRASLTARSVAVHVLSPEEFERGAKNLASRVGFQTAACAKNLADAHATALAETRSKKCQPAATPEAEAKQKDACLKAFDDALRESLATHMKAADCSSDAEKKAMTAIDAEFRALVMNGLILETKGDLNFNNAPRQRVSFGLVEALALRPAVDDPRVKLDDGEIVADPLSRLLTIVTVNSSFRSYDSSSVTITQEEKWRWFGGAVVVPDFGLAAGISWQPIRGVSINGGGAWLFVKSASETAIGSPPANARDAFDLGHARTWFIGAGYNFK